MSRYPDILQFDRIAYDTETTGLHWWKDKIFGVSISTPDGKDYYWDIRNDPNVVSWLRDMIPRCKMVIGHNIKFDCHMSRELGIILPWDRCDDTMIRAAIIDEHMLSYDLDSVAKKYLGVGKDTDMYHELADIFGGAATKNVQMKNISRAPSAIVERYAKRDTRACLDLYDHQQGLIEKQELQAVCELERQLIPVLVDIEYHGVRVDEDEARKAVKTITTIAESKQRELNQLAGFEVNPNPSGSIHQLFKPELVDGQWFLCDGTLANATGAGKASIDANTLRIMKHPAAALILSLRKMLKTRDTFLKGHILAHANNGRVHANFNQTRSDNDLGTITGRLSVNSPALQQIHKRDADIASVVRALFLPDYFEHDWVCNDWAQMDFRVFAHYVNDPRIIQMYADNPDTDFHQLTSDMTGLPRSGRFSGDPNAKQINLGLVFGMGQGKLAQEMGLPCEITTGHDGKVYVKPGSEAMAVFEKYHSSIPGVQSLLGKASAVAKSRGFVKTILGRNIRFPRGQFTHKAGGLIFQGSAADALKVKLIELWLYFKEQNNGSRLMLNVHDEFDCSVPKGDTKTREDISRIVIAFNEGDRINFRVPIRTDQGIGDNWWEASK